MHSKINASLLLFGGWDRKRKLRAFLTVHFMVTIDFTLVFKFNTALLNHCLIKTGLKLLVCLHFQVALIWLKIPGRLKSIAEHTQEKDKLPAQVVACFLPIKPNLLII